jgi:hypothetical protein
MLTNKLYDENLNPTPLMSEFLNDIRDSGIYDVLLKYRDILPPHEVVGFISSELHYTSVQYTIKTRVRKRNES